MPQNNKLNVVCRNQDTLKINIGSMLVGDLFMHPQLKNNVCLITHPSNSCETTTVQYTDLITYRVGVLNKGTEVKPATGELKYSL